MSGLFQIFSVSKSGMFVQQTALHTNAHNIANANTDGYSVQRVNLKTTEPFGMPALTTPAEPGQIGTGVKVDSITRARDTFLDAQIRKENSTQGKYEVREQFLSEIESIFMEPSDEGLASSLTKFWDSWHQLATNPESSTARTLVAQNGDSLATAISHHYTQLEDMERNAGDLIRDNVFDVASTLNQIRDLNEEIRAVSISGRNPNDLMDRRDLLLDNLSKKFSFEKKDTEYNGIEIIPKPVNTSIGTGEVGKKDGVILRDTKLNYGVAYVNNITYEKALTKWTIELHIDGDINKSVTLTTNNDTDIEKYLNVADDKKTTTISNIKSNAKASKEGESDIPSSSYFKVVNYDYTKYDRDTKKFADTADKLIIPKYENGSLNGLQTINEEIDNYKDQLNNMAKILAISVNTIQTNSTDNTDNNDDKSKTINFFNTEAEYEPEAAKSLRVNDAILKDVSLINAGKDIETGNAGNGERALLMGTLRNTRIDILGINNTDISLIKDDNEKIKAYREAFIKDVFKDKDGKVVNDASDNLADDEKIKMSGDSSGTTIDAYFKNSIASLGVSNQEAKRMVSNEKALLSQLDERKESTSGVSLDEEVTNMIQFSKSYQANAKMISIIDELLDVVVNGLIRR